MKYDFDATIERKGTSCSKWDNMKTGFGSNDLIPLWVADTDFPCPKPVQDAIMERAAHPVFGYTFPPDSCYEAIIEKTVRDYGWSIEREWIVICDTIVGGFYDAIRSVTVPGDSVIIQPPVYPPFAAAVQNSGCVLVENPLVQSEDSYEIDFSHLQSCFGERTKALLFCSPHNPVGRVWTPDELSLLGRMCLENNCIIISDEIHCDLVFAPNHHTTLASMSPELANQTITFLSASKTFNIAGLSTSVAIIPNPELRAAFINARSLQNSGNLFGYAALEAAYRHGGEYLEQLLPYLQRNIDFVVEFVEKHLPQLKVIRPEGTYLLWVDMQGLGMEADALRTFLIETCGLALNDGRTFGTGGEGFVRFNLGCPLSTLEEALTRIQKALL